MAMPKPINAVGLTLANPSMPFGYPSPIRMLSSRRPLAVSPISRWFTQPFALSAAISARIYTAGGSLSASPPRSATILFADRQLVLQAEDLARGGLLVTVDAPQVQRVSACAPASSSGVMTADLIGEAFADDPPLGVAGPADGEPQHDQASEIEYQQADGAAEPRKCRRYPHPPRERRRSSPKPRGSERLRAHLK